MTSASSSASDARARLVHEARKALRYQLLERWYPHVLDREHGGYLADFSADFEPDGPQSKFLLHQARHLWVTSKAAEHLPHDPRYREAADYGFRFLRDVMRDRQDGGFIDRVSREGRSGDRVQQIKDVYGIAFAIWGLAAYFTLTGEQQSLRMAITAFHWLEEFSHDREHGGYLRYLGVDGRARAAGPLGQPPKDQDSSLHLIEAFTELVRVWPDALLRTRLEELCTLVRGPMAQERGTLLVSFERDWTPVRTTEQDRREGRFFFDHVSFGHDLETALLLVEAAEVDGRPADPDVLAFAKRLVDHTLDHGWDPVNGGFFDGGYYFSDNGPCEIVIPTKTFWAEFEALNTLSLMAQRFPDEPRNYLGWLDAQWRYCDQFLADHDRGGWYWFARDGQPDPPRTAKGSPWKATYHIGRSLLGVIHHLDGNRKPERSS